MEITPFNQALDLLEKIEWQYDDGHGPPQCPVCQGWGDGDGHIADCQLAHLLDSHRPDRPDPWIPTSGLNSQLMDRAKTRRSDTR